VLKDDATNTWYDNMGKNFAVPLRAPQAALPGAIKAPKVPDQLPRALCDTWSWIKWDHAGVHVAGANMQQSGRCCEQWEGYFSRLCCKRLYCKQSIQANSAQAYRSIHMACACQALLT
jgi:hypothetical protein